MLLYWIVIILGTIWSANRLLTRLTDSYEEDFQLDRLIRGGFPACLKLRHILCTEDSATDDASSRRISNLRDGLIDGPAA